MRINYSAIVLCAGSGKRSGLAYNKMLYRLDHQTVYEKVMQVFLNDPRCLQIVVVCKVSERDTFASLIEDERIVFIEGGVERQDSVYAGLQCVSQDYVMIHDGARPYVSQVALDRLCETLEKHEACLLMVPCKDTIKKVVDGKVVKTLVRSELMQAQTPQAFLTELIVKAYDYCTKNQVQATDDASMAELYGADVYVVQGDYNNIKITTPEDL